MLFIEKNTREIERAMLYLRINTNLKHNLFLSKEEMHYHCGIYTVPLNYIWNMVIQFTVQRSPKLKYRTNKSFKFTQTGYEFISTVRKCVHQGRCASTSRNFFNSSSVVAKPVSSNYNFYPAVKFT